MEHSEKVRQLEESRERRRQSMVIYPVANQQGCAMAPFAFVQAAEAVARERAVAGTADRVLAIAATRLQ